MVINDPTWAPALSDVADRLQALECKVKNLEERELDHHRRLVAQRIALQSNRQRALIAVDDLISTYKGKNLHDIMVRVQFVDDCNKLRGMIMATCPD